MEKNDWKKSDPNAWKHWKEAGDNTVWIPIENIKPCRWGKGIRNQEKYENTKENININGLNERLQVWPIGDLKFEVYIGDHRLLILKELGWERIPCMVEDLPENKALEKCLSDNIARSNYSGVELENWAYELQKTGRYKTHEELGKKAMGGISKSRVGQLLESYNIRKCLEVVWDESRVTLLKISPEVLLDTRLLPNDVDRAAVCKKVLKGEWLAGQVRKRCKVLANWALDVETEELKNKVLYQNASYDSIVSAFKDQMQKATKADRTKTTTIKNPNFIFTMYDRFNENLHKCLSILDESDDIEAKKLADDYLKATIGLILENMTKYKLVDKEKGYREKIQQVRDLLGLHRPTYRNYDGGSVGGIDSWGGKKSKKEK